MPPDTRTTPRPEFLVLDDDVRFASVMRRLLVPHGKVTVVHSVKSALEAEPTWDRWTALFVDFELPDGDGLDVVEAFHARSERVPAVLITGHVLDNVANRAFGLGVKILTKPITLDHITRFLDDVSGTSAIREVVDEWRVRYALTGAETEVFRDALEGVERGAHAERRGISETTLRTHVRHMLGKTGDANLSDAVQRGLREVIGRKPR